MSISETTRGPRNYEKDGVDYFFVDKASFEQGIQEGKYLEYAQVYGNYYGTPKEFVENLLNSGYDVILEIDIRGRPRSARTIGRHLYLYRTAIHEGAAAAD